MFVCIIIDSMSSCIGTSCIHTGIIIIAGTTTGSVVTCFIICGLVLCGITVASSVQKRRFLLATNHEASREERNASPIYDTIDPKFYDYVLPEKVSMSGMTDNAAYMMN